MTRFNNLSIFLLLSVFSLCVLGGKISLRIKDAVRPIKHLYMDFDHTITVDGFSGDIRNMFCRGGKYPACDCSYLPGKVCNGTDETSANAMISALDSLPEKGMTALIESFGGSARLNYFRKWLDTHRRLLNGHVYIVSTSWFPVTALQWKLYLKKVSDDLDLGFDLTHIKTLADPGPGLSADKGSVIKENMRVHNINFDEAMFTDDSSGNIKSAKDVCNTVYLPQKKGLDQTDLEYIDVMVAGCGRRKGNPVLTFIERLRGMINTVFE